MSDILDIYEKLGGKISQKEFNKLIEEKMEAMGGLCDERTAAMLVAHDLGVEGASAIKIRDISLDKRNVELIGKVIGTYPPREFSRQDGTAGRVANITIADETGEIRVVLWDELADLVKTGVIKDDDVFRVKGYVKEGQQGLEVSIGRGGGLIKDEAAKITIKDQLVRIKELKTGMGNVSTRGVILSRQEPKTFNRKDGSIGTLAGLMLGDDTGKIRVTVWDTKIKDLDPFQPGESIELLHAYTREAFNGGVELQVGNRGIIKKSEVKVKYEVSTTKISEIVPDQSYNVRGTVTGIDGVREFTTKDGKPGRLCGLHLSDDSGRVRVIFWGELANLAEALSVGDRIIVTDAQAKVGLKQEIELSANWRSSVQKIE
ncbi:MAG TPA: OB-fold nucleic acid binding domain-containing protein [Methanocella sp.]|nr:OB-fold nucleic acid binding domain-containing protein [Methanocella sp.]